MRLLKHVEKNCFLFIKKANDALGKKIDRNSIEGVIKKNPKLMKIIFEMKHEIEDHLLSFCRSSVLT